MFATTPGMSLRACCLHNCNANESAVLVMFVFFNLFFLDVSSVYIIKSMLTETDCVSPKFLT